MTSPVPTDFTGRVIGRGQYVIHAKAGNVVSGRLSWGYVLSVQDSTVLIQKHGHKDPILITVPDRLIIMSKALVPPDFITACEGFDERYD